MVRDRTQDRSERRSGLQSAEAEETQAAKKVSINERIRDDLVEHDIDLQRVCGDVRNKAERRWDQLGRELKGLIAKHDVHGAVRKRTREKRTAEFQIDARAAINAATKDVHDLLRTTLRGVARLESTTVVDSIMENLK